MEDSGFDYSVLSEFRDRLVAGNAEQLIFEKMLECFKAQGLFKAKGKQRSDSTHVLSAVRALNRLLCAGECLRRDLNDLTIIAPKWLREVLQPEWFYRYERRMEESRLPKEPLARLKVAETIVRDGWKLLQAVYNQPEGQWLQQVPAVKVLRKVWVQQFEIVNGDLVWRENDNIPPATLFISSPYDLEAHYGKKKNTKWIGYKVHLTETCEADYPFLITNVETSYAPTSDHEFTPVIHEHLKRREILPGQHLIDSGYTEAKLLVSSSEEYGVELVGPSRPNVHWQNKNVSNYSSSNFKIDWEAEKAVCPQGKESSSWTPASTKSGKAVIKIRFSQKDCKICQEREECTKSNRRLLTVERSVEYKALQQAREQEKSEEFKQYYAQRAGVEGTISAGVRTYGLRQTRYRGIEKTHLQHVATAVGMLNIVRIIDWVKR